MFNAIGGWVTQFEIDGVKVGGAVDILPKDPRLLWQLEQIGGAEGKIILELGPLEGAHTKMLHDAGAMTIVGVEGLNDCFLRCLVVKEAFDLYNARFYFADFNQYIENHIAKNFHKFDVVSAAGVLYHQRDPVTLIRNLSRITDTVLVWSQVASEVTPGGPDTWCKQYRGKMNLYHGTRLTSESYCGGLHDTAFWFYPDEMLRCFRDAGFNYILEKPSPDNINGKSLLFVASKNKFL
jgi:2-polyprenyl-3-methyl-5-hydroxy-6-metoxy-1,4-benzoquinol methylase